MASPRTPEQLIEAALSLMTPRERRRLRMRWALQSAYDRTICRLPGYRKISLLLWRAKRGGWRAVFEPPFNIMKQDRDTYDPRLRWHAWGVLNEGDLYRAYTPTRRSCRRFGSTQEAWLALEAVYWGKPSDVAWEPLPVTRSPDRASPRSLSVSQDELARAAISKASALPREHVPSPPDAEWRPIETAPRDGTWFIASSTDPGWGAVRVVRFKSPYDRLPTDKSGAMWPSVPTHWMPLPLPPLVVEGGSSSQSRPILASNGQTDAEPSAQGGS